MTLLKIRKLSLFISVIYSSLYQNFCFASQEALNDSSLEWRLSFRSVKTISFDDEFDWGKYLPLSWDKRESSSDSRSAYQSSLNDGLDEILITQVTDILLPLSNQIGSLTDQMVDQVINILSLVRLQQRENFIQFIKKERIFHTAHFVHYKGYDVIAAINFLGCLALTFDQETQSSSINFLGSLPSLCPEAQRIIAAW